MDQMHTMDRASKLTSIKSHDMRYVIDPTKIHNELGWLPETKFENGIKRPYRGILITVSLFSGKYQKRYEKMYGNR